MAIFQKQLFKLKLIIMGFHINDKKDGKPGGKAPKAAPQNSKFIAKPGKAAGPAKKPIKTGGSRGS